MKRYKARTFIYILVCITILASSCGSVREYDENMDIYPFVLYPVEKLRPMNIPDACSRATIRLAKNEYEPIIFGLRNNSNNEIHVCHILVRTNPLCGFTYDLYRVSYYHVKKRSRWFDKPDVRRRWPDPLIPLIPSDYPEAGGNDGDSEVQKFVPVPDVIIPPGENRLFLLDLYLLPDVVNKPGTVTLSIVLTNTQAFNSIINVSPWKFSLPNQSKLRTSVKCKKKDITKLHKKKSYLPFNEDSLFYEYYKLLSRFRLFLYMSDDPIIQKQVMPAQGKRDWSDFDDFFSPMLDGSMFEDDRESPVFYFPEIYNKAKDKDALSDFFTSFTLHLKERGWLEKSVYYLVDEPLNTDYPDIREKAEYIKKHAPGLRIMVTDPFSEALEEVIDIWCVDIPFIGDSVPFLPAFMKNNHPRSEFQIHYSPSRYQQRSSMGEEFWIYTCTSAQILDYPNLFIDSCGLSHRIIPWLIFKYKGSGFYYWNATYSYKGNPWENQYYFVANGDGTLVYPGLPGMYGLLNHMPIPSLRMILLREGLEDYEYLCLAARLFPEDSIQFLCNKMVTSSLFWEHDAGSLQVIRNEIADMIDG